MKKILVTTDFSTHSKAGMRFAVRMADQMKAELVFFHCFQALIPATIHRERIENSMAEQARRQLQQLERFVAGFLRKTERPPANYRCVVKEELSPESAILEYAQREKFDFICISTRGAGQLQKIIGTNTGDVIRKSPVPVLAVPHTYRARPVRNILYATDLENTDRELAIVTALAKALEVKVDIAHFSVSDYLQRARTALDTAALARKYEHLGRIYLETYDLREGFVAQLDHLIKKVKPSLVVFFTHTNLNWFDKLFSRSRAEMYSFIAKAPMLVYRKER